MHIHIVIHYDKPLTYDKILQKIPYDLIKKIKTHLVTKVKPIPAS